MSLDTQHCNGVLEIMNLAILAVLCFKSGTEGEKAGETAKGVTTWFGCFFALGSLFSFGAGQAKGCMGT